MLTGCLTHLPACMLAGEGYYQLKTNNNLCLTVKSPGAVGAVLGLVACSTEDLKQRFMFRQDSLGG